MPKNLGNLLLAAFLVLTGLNAFINIGFLGYVNAALAIAAGVLIGLANKP